MRCLACAPTSSDSGALRLETLVQNSAEQTNDRSRRAAGAMASNFAEAFEKLQSQDTPVQRRAAAARASTRVEVLQEVVVQDRVADRAALPAPTSTLAAAVEKLRRLQARCEQSRTTAADARARRGKKQPTPSWEELEDELRRSQEALRARVAVGRPEPAEPRGHAPGIGRRIDRPTARITVLLPRSPPQARHVVDGRGGGGKRPAQPM